MIKNPPIIKKIASKMGYDVRDIIPERGIFSISKKNKRLLVFRKFKLDTNMTMGIETTKFKDLTSKLLLENNIPTPKTITVYKKTQDMDKIKQSLATLRYPIVIKDAQGSQSNCVYTNIQDFESAKKIIEEQIDKYPKLVIQEMIFGTEYRILILGDKAIAATRLIPPRIFGNGKDTVLSLIEKKQENTKKTPLDAALTKVLSEQGVNLETILPEGRIIYLRRNSALAEGGETEDVTDLVHKSIKKICAKAAHIVGKNLAGIDIICDDLTKNWKEQKNFSIIEINGKPDIYIHYNPSVGQTRNVVGNILGLIFKKYL